MNALEKLGYKGKDIGDGLYLFERPLKLNPLLTENILLDLINKVAKKTIVGRVGETMFIGFYFHEILALAEIIKEEEKK